MAYYFVPKRCPSTSKIMYLQRQTALQAADQSEKERGVRLWVYKCGFCGTWHLTHTPPHSDYGEADSFRSAGGHKPHSRKRGYKPRRR